jgi:SRSO17 transposase
MQETEEFECYLEHLGQVLGNVNQRVGLMGYCTGLMAPLKRKSVEPMAAQLEPANTRAKHQSLHHFVSQSRWSDEALLLGVAQWVVPEMDFAGGAWWVIDDTGFPKQGKHSVGVARQYCGMLGKQDNCQVAVSVSLACEQASLPVAWQLYLPKVWASDAARRAQAGVPEGIEFATKPAIALAQIQTLMAQGAPKHAVLADAGYGVDGRFRQGLTDLGLHYVVGITSTVTVWSPTRQPLPPKPYRGRGTKPKLLRVGDAPPHCPQTVKALAFELPAEQWQDITWREGTNQTLSSRFARVRVQIAHRTELHSELPQAQWLLMEWPQGDKEPFRYWLSTLPEETALARMVFEAKMRWRIERDYQDLKQEVGLGHFEGRNWRGFHHHASLSIAAYGYLVAWQLKRRREQPGQEPAQEQKQDLMPAQTSESAGGGKSAPATRQEPAVPQSYKPRGSPAHAAPRSLLPHDLAPADSLSTDAQTPSLPLLLTCKYLTQ